MTKRFQENLGQHPIVRINGVSKERLRNALMMRIRDDHIVGFGIDKGNKHFVLFNGETEGMLPLPFELDIEGATEFIWQWLHKAIYPEEPVNNKGSNEKGWLLYCDEGGMIKGFSEGAFVAIEPHWIMLDEQVEPEQKEELLEAPPKSELIKAADIRKKRHENATA